jgi:hypothetical protein
MGNFKDSEFTCKCCNSGGVTKHMKEMLEDARKYAGVSMVITSGYRCEDNNKNAGGSPTSSHLKGLAVDIKVIGSTERFQILKGLIMAGFTRIGIAKTFIHADVDSSKSSNVSWMY